MLKNIEWGAITYLTTSIYGQGLTEVRINNSSIYITGCAASVEYGSNYNGCQNKYNTTIGYLASTTGNISGIYDMNGIMLEYVMGVMKSKGSNTPNVSSSGFTTLSESKYYDIYTYSTSSSDLTRYHLGDATAETKGWNGDNAYFVDSRYPWFIRGNNGIFASNISEGAALDNRTSRAVLR